MPDTDTSIRYIDALILFRSGKRWAVEIKVTPADLRQEIARPEKTALWRAHTHAFYYAVPTSLAPIALAEVPSWAGVYVAACGSYDSNIGSGVVRRAKQHQEPDPIPEATWRRLARKHGSWHVERSLPPTREKTDDA